MTGSGDVSELSRLADVDSLDLSTTRFRAPKQVALRVMRVFSSQQAAFNRAVVASISARGGEAAGVGAEGGPTTAAPASNEVVEELRAKLAWLDRTVIDIHGPLLTEVRADLVRLTDAVSELTWRLERLERAEPADT